MDKVYDFSNAQLRPRTLGGSDRKIRVLFEDKHYMLKFTDEHVKRGGLSTSHENNVFSEYISSHIAQSIGLKTHNTVIGMYKDEICVGCEDYRNNYRVRQKSIFLHTSFKRKEVSNERQYTKSQ